MGESQGAVFRALTRLRAATIKEFDTIARLEGQRKEKAAARKVNESAVRAQISGKDDIRKQERVDYLEEGKRVREKVEAERQKIRDIQAGKIEELNDVGIDKKYLYDL